MPTQIFYANQFAMASTISRQDGDQGDVLLICQCVGPQPPHAPNPGDPQVLGELVLGLTYANAVSLSEMLREQIEAPRDPRYKGPVIKRS